MNFALFLTRAYSFIANSRHSSMTIFNFRANLDIVRFDCYLESSLSSEADWSMFAYC